MDSAADLPEPSFRLLAAQLVTQALMELGEIPNPLTGRTSVSRPRARLTIDILDILRDKTRGNLDPEDAAFLDRALYELKSKAARAGGGS